MRSRRDDQRLSDGAGLRRLAIATVGFSLAALAGAACALSYPGVRDLAAEAGVSAQLARIYPLAADALLVIAGCSVLALRGAGLMSKLYSWLCLLVLLMALAAGSAAHAAGTVVSGRPAQVVTAVIPWVLLLAGFGLLLVLLRNARLRRADGGAAAGGGAAPAGGEAAGGGAAAAGSVADPAMPAIAEPGAEESPAAALPLAVPPPRPVQAHAGLAELRFAGRVKARPEALDERAAAPATEPATEVPAVAPELRRAHSTPTPPGD